MSQDLSEARRIRLECLKMVFGNLPNGQAPTEDALFVAVDALVKYVMDGRVPGVTHGLRANVETAKPFYAKDQDPQGQFSM